MILLVIEYRTSFFVQHIPTSTGRPRKTLKQLLKKPDLGEGVYKARLNLAKIYGVDPNSITIANFEASGWPFTKIRIEASIPRHSDFHYIYAGLDERILKDTCLCDSIRHYY